MFQKQMLHTKISEETYPFVSILMPVRDEARWIAHSVNAVLRQDYPVACMEIILADGMSEDNTVEIVSHLPDAKRVQIITNPQQIQASGLNLALKLAQGEVIVRVDGHTVIAPDYVLRCVEILRETGAENVGGSINPVGYTVMGRAIAAASKSSFAVPTAFRVSMMAQFVDTVYMGAWQRRVFEQVGGFDEQFVINEDYELNYRIRRAGGKIYYSPEICSQYYGQQTLHRLARQYFRYGWWKPRTLIKHPASLRLRHVVAPLFVAFMVLGALIPEFATLWTLSSIAYLLTNLLFSLRCRPPDWRVPLVFVTVHIAWGCGFWFGTGRLLLQNLRRSLP